MKMITEKSRLNGTVAIPGSKSHTIRAVAIASLASGKSTIRNPLVSDDTISAVSCYMALGAKIDTSNQNIWNVTGTAGKVAAPPNGIDVGNSGTTIRLAISTAALAGPDDSVQLTGDSQICSRPVGPLLQSLSDLGAKAISKNNNGSAPVIVSGRIKGGTTTIECLSSQYLSSLLLATPLADGDSEINVALLNEPDYVQITLDWLDSQGIEYENQQLASFKIKGGQRYRAFDSTIPADFSSATFFLCAGAILNADITLTGLDFSDSQPDKAVADYLRTMGADITIGKETVRVKGSSLTGTTIDMNRTPDALPAMAVVAAFAKGTTKLFNVPQARSKETDRISCMAQELAKMGVKTEELPDGIIIHGSAPKATLLNGWGDHRIVMALSIAGMAIDGRTTIDTAEAAGVTFPDYVELMKSLGANIETK
jgi:3-phosphoshikimate 1-carboxyvinyltransferase